MKIRIIGKGLPQAQVGGDENWIRKIFDYESRKGSATGTGLSNWGYNSRNPKSIDEAINFYKQDFLPKVQQYPMGIRERAGDFIYNAGREPRVYMLDQYLKTVGDKKGLPNRGSYNIDMNKNPDAWAKIAPQFEAEWDKYSNDINQLPLDQQIKFLDQGKDFYYQNINQVNGKPSPSYNATWKGRLGIFGQYAQPTQTPTSSNPIGNTSYTYNGVSLDPRIPEAAKVITQQEALMNDDMAEFNAYNNLQLPKLQAKTIPFTKTTLPALPTLAPQSFTGSMPSMQSSTIEEPARKWHSEWDNQGFDTDPASPLYQPNTQQAAKTKKPLFSQATVKTANNISDWADVALMTGAAVDYFGQNQKLKDYERAYRQNQFDNQVVSPMFRGNTEINTGRFRENVTRKPNEGMFQMGGEENFANTSNMIKIRITGKPENLEFEYGGQNGYGLDLGQRRVQTEMPAGKADSVSSSIGAVPRYAANIEAEGGETVYGDIDGDGGLEHMTINGKRHSQGGVPLNVPEGSFIFSDTKKMKIKDPSILTMFGKSPKAGGYTPAEIAKKYDINKYKAIVEDPEADEISKATAQLMLTNYRKKLSSLALVQEEMKGFPQGIPSVVEGAKDQMPIAAYGGYIPEYQLAGQVVDPLNPYQIFPQAAELAQQQALLQDLDRRQAASKPTRVPDANEITDQTVSPKSLADVNDPEFAKYKQLLEKYDTKLVKGSYNINSMSAADAKDFARLSGKFGFSRKDPKGGKMYNVIQSSTPGLTFKGSKGKKAGFFGGYSPDMYERRLVEDSLGEDAVKNMSELDIRKAYFKELGVDVSNLSDEQLKNKKSLYANKNFFEKQFYPKFADKFVGDQYRTQLGDDMMIGAEHYDSYRTKPKMVPGRSPIGYKCTGVDDAGNPMIIESSYMDAEAMAADGAVGSRQAAAMQCTGSITPNQITPGKTTPSKAGFLTPDKLALLTAGLNPPQAYLPSVADLPYRQGDLALEDWLSKAQQRQQTYNISANTLGQYQPGTAMASNLSFLAGQTGEGVSQDIAQTDSRNVDRANQFMAQELQRKTANDAYNAAARDKRWEGFVTTKQNLDNARRKYLTGITQAANNAFANRMYLDMVNKVNPIYNVDPTTGLSFFKEGYDASKLGAPGFAAASSNVGPMAQFPALKNQYLRLGMTEANAEKQAISQLSGGRTTYSDTDNDGIPNTTRTTMAQQMPGMYRNAFGFNIGGVVGPWR